MGKVIYGLKNVHYALYDSATNTYGAWKRIPAIPSLLLAGLYDFRSLLHNPVFSGEMSDCYPLIILRDLQAKIPAAGVNDKVEIIFLVPVHFDEMVSAAQSADALERAPGVDASEALQLGEVDPFAVAVGLLPHVPAVRDIFADERI